MSDVPPPGPPPTPSSRPGLGQRVRTLRAVVAVALASVVPGGPGRFGGASPGGVPHRA